MLFITPTVCCTQLRYQQCPLVATGGVLGHSEALPDRAGASARGDGGERTEDTSSSGGSPNAVGRHHPTELMIIPFTGFLNLFAGSSGAVYILLFQIFMFKITIEQATHTHTHTHTQ